MIAQVVTPTPFAVGDVNTYLLKGDALTLVDAGTKTPEAYEAIRSGLREHGYSIRDIEQVFITHHHPDHCGWVEAFEHADILGHAYTGLWLSRNEEFVARQDVFYEQCLSEAGVPSAYFRWIEKIKRSAEFIGNRPLDRVVEDGDELPGHPGWSIVETLGHAQSHLSLWSERTGELIGGDLVLGKVSSNPLIEPPLEAAAPRPKALLQYNASLKQLLEMPVEVVYAGHGDEVRQVHELIRERLAKQHERAMAVYHMLEAGPQTVFQVNQQLFPAVYEKELGLTLSETLGQLDYLSAEGFVKEIADDRGVSYYEQC